jgi:hypothetical protein
MRQQFSPAAGSAESRSFFATYAAPLACTEVLPCPGRRRAVLEGDAVVLRQNASSDFHAWHGGSRVSNCLKGEKRKSSALDRRARLGARI